MKSAASTQENVPIAGIKDGIVILKDGQYRMVLEVAAINFSLKSEEEQNSLVLQYQSFLNSIHFPIEITIRSKKLDLAPYINRIKKLNEKQTNELLKIQTSDYIDFISQLINLANIMKKTFYVTIGYQPLTIGQGTVLDKLFNRKKETVSSLTISDEEFAHNLKELRTRGQNVAQLLGAMGLHCKQLNTEQIIELLYGIYNPEVAGKERLTGAENISSTFVASEDEKKEKIEPGQTPETGEPPAIDNREVVIEQEKKKSQEKAFENQSAEQRGIGMNQPEGTLNVAEKTEAQHSVKNRLPRPEGARNDNNNQQPANTQNQKPSSVIPSKAEGSEKNPAAPVGPNPNQNQTVQQQVADPKLNKNFGW